MSSYCYVSRFNSDKVYINENTEQILSSIDKWVQDKPWEKIPNQCDNKYYVIDIGCSTDVPLMSKYYDWQVVFDFFNNHEKLKSTFATKYPTRFREYNIDPQKNRIRVSLMPQIFSNILEPNTDKIDDRIACPIGSARPSRTDVFLRRFTNFPSSRLIRVSKPS
jgi:DNA repair photolyase